VGVLYLLRGLPGALSGMVPSSPSLTQQSTSSASHAMDAEADWKNRDFVANHGELILSGCGGNCTNVGSDPALHHVSKTMIAWKNKEM
jgi:hypothetical protein